MLHENVSEGAEVFRDTRVHTHGFGVVLITGSALFFEVYSPVVGVSDSRISSLPQRSLK